MMTTHSPLSIHLCGKGFILDEEEHIEYMKDVLKSAKSELPTLKLQLISLVRFMRAAGYEPEDEQVPIRFKLVKPIKDFPLEVNIDKAVKLHNMGFFWKTTAGYVVPTGYSFARVYRVLDEACKQKVVKQIYLQWSKKRKEWIVNKHQVEFQED